MAFNIVSIIALAIILVLGFLGLKRGLIMSVWHLVSAVVIMALTITLSPYVTKLAKNNEKIYGFFYSKVQNTVKVPTTNTGDVEEFIKDFKLPEKVEKIATEYAVNKFADKEKQQSFENSVHEKLTGALLTVLGFIVTLIVVAIGMTLLVKLINKAAELPVIKTFNKLGGVLLGVLEGILIIWCAIGIVPMLSATEFGGKLIEQIQADRFLSVLYEHNIVSTIMSARILSFFK